MAIEKLRQSARDVLDWWTGIARDAALATLSAQSTPFDGVGSVLGEYKDRLQVAAEQARQLQQLLDRATRGEDLWSAIARLEDELRVSGRAVQQSGQRVASRQQLENAQAGAREQQAAVREEQRRNAESARADQQRERNAAMRQLQEVQDQNSARLRRSLQAIDDDENTAIRQERERIQRLISADDDAIRSALESGSQESRSLSATRAKQSAAEEIEQRSLSVYRDMDETRKLVASFSAVVGDFARIISGQPDGVAKQKRRIEVASSLLEIQKGRIKRLDLVAKELRNSVSGLAEEGSASELNADSEFTTLRPSNNRSMSSGAMTELLTAASPLPDKVRLAVMDCDGGNIDACANAGVLVSQAGNGKGHQSLYVALFRNGCDGGEVTACFNLGLVYSDGVAVSRDVALAARLYLKACDGGEASACTNLGVLYKTGNGVVQDKARAAELYRKGCDAGNIVGCYNLGKMYTEGDGIPQDLSIAITLFRKACDGNLALACAKLRDR